MQDILSQVHISDLVEQTDIQDNDVFPIDSTTDTLKVKASVLKQYIGGELASGKIDKTEKGAVNGVATLDGNGFVPSSQLPSFVDDVLEGTAQNPTQTAAGTYSATGFILTGESTPCTLEEGKTYVDTSSNIQYRWTGTGSNLVSMGSGLVLGETQYSAYAGNKGKANADAISALQSGKVDKVDGKGLSTEDFTTEEKQKLATLVVGENYAELSEAYAIGTRNGVPVTSEDITFHNNSKYHADQAHESEIRSGSFANIAGLSAESAEQSEIRSGSFANVAGASAANAVENALKSEGFAVGKQNGTDVGSTSPYYHNNAEYFKNLAEEAAAQAGALDMTGATATTDGTHGLIKQPHAGDQDKFFRGDGTYKSVVADKVVLSSPLNIGGQSQTEVEGSIQALNNTKQDNLTFDNSPTQNSNNPVKSDGIYTEIAKCIDYEMTTPSLSAGSVNITLYNPAITAEMKARPYADYSTSGAYADLTVNTYDGSVNLTGTVSAATTITFRLYTPTVISNIPQ